MTLIAGDKEHIIGNIYTGIDKVKQNKLISEFEKEVYQCIGCDIYNSCENVRCRFINKSKSGEYNCVLPIDCHIMNLKYECNGVRHCE